MKKGPESAVFVRHAESKANIGESYESNAAIELSFAGHQQALVLSEKLEVPDIIIVSKFLRTQDTAKPFIEKNPTVPVTTSMLTHEFHYLSSSRFKNKISEDDKKKLRKEYWNNMDPFYKDIYGDDDTTESFAEFTERVHKFLLYLSDLKNNGYDTILIFTHGLFIRLLLLLTKEFPKLFIVDGAEKMSQMKLLMSRFREVRNTLTIDNASIHDLSTNIEKYLKEF